MGKEISNRNLQNPAAAPDMLQVGTAMLAAMPRPEVPPPPRPTLVPPRFVPPRLPITTRVLQWTRPLLVTGAAIAEFVSAYSFAFGVGATAGTVILGGDSTPKTASPIQGEPNLDDLRRKLDDAQRDEEELQRQTPPWYWDPFSPDLVSHFLKKQELSRWISHLNLEIDLKEWEDARGLSIAQNPSEPPLFEDQQITRLRHAISENATQSAREQGAAHRIMASATSGGDKAAPAADAEKKDSPTEQDWEALAAAGDNLAFAKVEDEFVQESNQAVVVRIDRGDTEKAIVTWFKQTISPQIHRIETAVSTLQRNDDEKQVFHDIRNRLAALKSMTLLFLEAGKKDVVRSMCLPPNENLMSIVRFLKSQFALTTSIKVDGLEKLRLSPNVDLDAFMAIVVNLVKNASEHPAVGKKVTPITIRYFQGMIIVDDKGSGMTEEALEYLQSGVRIHNGVVVHSEGGQHLDGDAQDHGYGTKIVREMCDQLGIDMEIDSELGRGTTVVLVLPEGMIEPDLMDTIIRGAYDDENLKEVIASLSYERRLELVGEMNVAAQNVFDQRIGHVVDSLLTGKSIENIQRQFREIGSRYTSLLDMLTEGLSTTDNRVRSAIWNAEVLRSFLQDAPTPKTPW